MQVEAWDHDARLAHLRLRREQAARKRRRKGLAIAGAASLACFGLVLSLIYAGPSDRLAGGVAIAGVDVGGLEPQEAVRVLEQREAAIAATPLPVQAGDEEVLVSARGLGVEMDWSGAVAEAQERVDGFRPLRGFRRLATRAFGTEVAAAGTVDDKKLDRLLSRVGRGDVAYRDASIKLDGLRPAVVSERAGLGIDREDAEAAILGAFASFDRSPVVLERRTLEPRVTAEMLQPTLVKVRTAVSRPVRLDIAGGHFMVSKQELRRVLQLPANGERKLAVAGPGADAYFKTLQSEVNRPPRDARFEPVPGGRVLIKPHELGRALDVPRTADALLAAALRPTNRQAKVVVATAAPARTTEDVKAMGITGIVGSYTTIYGGDANRVHNVGLVARLIDDTLIRPGQTFSFNDTTGERNAAKGFREAPVIINGELQTGLGGGVCQVSTTVFNAAFEAGLDIPARTNHGLYISHYPQGRDATVNYPDIDMKFVNDTGRWLLLRTFVGSSSMTVNLYGAPQRRRVESVVTPLRTVGPAPTTWRKDPSITKGQKVVVSAGTPARATSVHRLVYAPNGELLYDNTWSSYYRGEKRVVAVGTKPRPEPPKKESDDKPAAEEPATTPDLGPGL